MLATVGFVLAACTNAATPTPAATPSGSVATATPVSDGTLPLPELSVVRLGASIQELSQFAPMLAEMAGIYRKHGIDVAVTTFDTDSRIVAIGAGANDYLTKPFRLDELYASIKDHLEEAA